MSRETVQSHQRDRIVAAMADASRELGYSETAVADIIRKAGVSRRAFYELFSDKRAAFLAAIEAGLLSAEPDAATLVGPSLAAELERRAA